MGDQTRILGPDFCGDSRTSVGGSGKLSLVDALDASSPADPDDASGAAACDVCAWCRKLLRATRRDAQYCSRRCRQAAWRFRGRERAGLTATLPRRFAYADPPYPGLSAKYYGDHPDFGGEVDHHELIARLVDEFPDGWALSTSARSLRDILNLSAGAGADVWVGAWTKPAPPGCTRRPRSAWEPVVFAGGRQLPSSATTRLDWVHAAPMRSYPGAVVGTKPPAFCRWIFESLGVCRGDELVDLYPGSGAVGHAFREFVGKTPSTIAHGPLELVSAVEGPSTITWATR